jgi:predicted transposase/invertase (TIGR01784 family)
METQNNKPQRRRFNPLNDYFFYKVMGEEVDEVQLLGFLNAVLGRIGEDQFTSVKILENKTFTPEILGDKSVTLDVRAELQGKTKVNVEVQLRNKHNMDKRSLYYWGREYVRSLKSGGDYREMPNVIDINIVDYRFLPTKNYHTCFHLREDQEPGIVLTNSLEIHFINMVKYRNLRKRFRGSLCNDPLMRWLAWFDVNSPPELVEEVIKMDSAIQKASEQLEYLLNDEDVVRAYDVRFKAMCDLTSMRNYATRTGLAKGYKKGIAKGIAEGRAEGKAEGRAEGKEAAKLEDARKMKEMGDSVERIHLITGLPAETIEKL